MSRINRQVRRPRLQHRQDRDDRLSRTVEQQRHTPTRARAKSDEQVGQSIRGLIEFSVRPRTAVEPHRHRVGHTSHLLSEAHRYRCLRGRGTGQRGPVSDLVETSVLGGVEHIDRRQALRRILSHRRQDPGQPLDHRHDGLGIEYVGAELHRATDAGRGTLGIEPLAHGEDQIHPRGVSLGHQWRGVHVAQYRLGAGCTGGVLPGQHHLDQRVMAQATRRVEPVHQHLERHILMLVSCQTALTHLADQLAYGGVVGQVHPQHQGVHEEPDQIVQRRITTPGDRETHRHIRTGTQTRQQHSQRSLHHHETGRIVLPRNLRHPSLQHGRPGHLDDSSMVIGDRRVRAIRRQLEAIR